VAPGKIVRIPEKIKITINARFQRNAGWQLLFDPNTDRPLDTTKPAGIHRQASLVAVQRVFIEDVFAKPVTP